MALGESLAPATDMFAGGFSNLASKAIWLIPIVVIVAGFLIVYIIKKVREKNSQWTHTLEVRRVLENNRLSKPIIHRMRRFPIIKNAEVFELEKPLLGGYLLPELDEYTGLNEFSIILDKNNRIYTNKGEFFNPDKSSVNVSAKHAEVDIGRANINSKYKDINKVSKRIEWATIAKYAFMSIAIIAITIMAIVGLQKWGESKEFESQQAQAEAQAMESLRETMVTVEDNANINLLIIEKLKELYGTNNLKTQLNTIKST
jgi:hypothetical protein